MLCADFADLAEFIAMAVPGASLEYFRGVLAKSLHVEEIGTLQKLAFTASKTGYFDLTQRRVAADDYVYLIRRRHHRETGR